MTPRLGFLGVGWIGRARMSAIARSGLADIVAVADPSDESAAAAAADTGAEVVSGDDLLRNLLGLDGIVIATPSALHGEQAICALDHGLAVFCQKPLGRTGEECAAIVATARRADRLLGVDFSYRQIDAVERMREVIASGSIGDVYAADLTFHNGYGPDKPWFRDPLLAGGGCLIDLGIHLVDLVLWLLDHPKVDGVWARLFDHGRPVHAGEAVVEDYAVGRIDLAGGGVASIACSWNLPVGRDAIISAAFYGTAGAVALANVDGSFYRFRAERYDGTIPHLLSEGPDDWGGRAAMAWLSQLAASAAFDPRAEEAVDVAAVIDGMYGR